MSRKQQLTNQLPENKRPFVQGLAQWKGVDRYCPRDGETTRQKKIEKTAFPCGEREEIAQMAAIGGVAKVARLSETNAGQKLPRFDVSTQ
ncbi:unnamed protein product [Dibothriocephalus latus]|uniref:Uncharacterized protein n=1 Tax=Dibothriocephalus latus TaxID=60516 RepID=A0A3P7NRQ9_DIBLA|nr:unnamed protein product [Dibothriocephalus latus]